MKKPCENCPFRKDSQGLRFLGEKRAKEILESNEEEGFVCHKTIHGKMEERRQCSGAMIITKKQGTNQPFINLHKALTGEDIELLDEDIIFDNYEDFIKSQK